MRPTGKIEASVLERFPGDWHVIVELSRRSEDFREMCNHYLECKAVLAELTAAEGADPQRINEYETLVSELETEIRQTVDASS